MARNLGIVFILVTYSVVANAQIFSELISYFSDAACTNQTGYFYSFSERPTGPIGCILSANSDQYVTYQYNVSEPVIEKFIGYRASFGSCPMYSDSLRIAAAALPGACMTEPRASNGSFVLTCSSDQNEVTFYESDGANCTTSFGQTVDTRECTSIFFITAMGWCTGGGRLDQSPSAANTSSAAGSSPLTWIVAALLVLSSRVCRCK